jgi:DUF1365 family protein
MTAALLADTGRDRLPAGSAGVRSKEPSADCAPAVIHGQVMHRRRRPVDNAFRYPAFCLRLPLSCLGGLPALGIAHNDRGIVSFQDRDHGACDGSSLETWIRALLAAQGVDADGEIVLYAFPRMFGYAFNPVSFWVCHDHRGGIRAVLCEVRNTFGERHNYLLAHPDGRPLASGETLFARKRFHVSPFCEVKGRYAFRFHFGGDRWLARIDYFDDDGMVPLLETAISGRAWALERQAVRSLPWRYRLFTFGVIARIHWQALRLVARRVPFFAKPDPPFERTTR